MRRRILNILAGLSLTIFVATIVLWALCPFYQERIALRWRNTRDRDHWQCTAIWTCLDGITSADILIDKGVLMPGKRWYLREYNGWAHDWNVTPLHAAEVSNLLPGLREFRRSIDWGYRQESLVATWTRWSVEFQVPLWFVALLSGILPAWRFGGWKRRRRRYRLAHGLCVKCGYDLRSTPNRCPECGTVQSTTPGETDTSGR